MNAIVLASDSLSHLHIFMCLGLVCMGTMIATMGGAMLAWSMLPFSPSDAMSEPSEFHSTAAQQRYAATQWKLANVRAERARLLLEPSDSTLATRIEGVRSIVVC